MKTTLDRITNLDRRIKNIGLEREKLQEKEKKLDELISNNVLKDTEDKRIFAELKARVRIEEEALSAVKRDELELVNMISFAEVDVKKAEKAKKKPMTAYKKKQEILNNKELALVNYRQTLPPIPKTQVHQLTDTQTPTSVTPIYHTQQLISIQPVDPKLIKLNAEIEQLRYDMRILFENIEKENRTIELKKGTVLGLRQKHEEAIRDVSKAEFTLLKAKIDHDKLRAEALVTQRTLSQYQAELADTKRRLLAKQSEINKHNESLILLREQEKTQLDKINIVKTALADAKQDTSRLDEDL